MKSYEKREATNEARLELLELTKQISSLNYKLYEVYTANRALAIKILGYSSENIALGGKGVSREVEKIIDYYLRLGGRK
ncbi:hypothetical protein VFC49_00425 [Thermococcus sp. SY098]|uniref:hypothetical protein n=1 Tax=Thermococcus sp. SY098 TaxID=3111325 RepID=UPI002D79FE31|nr:hypothetical protein [Thermococcus sp. SY098]WRS52675.1 hypothetical protein VFC49_00425 [Thermococcus sp. SY098]